MAQESAGPVGCLSAFFMSSRLKALATRTSSNVSILVVRSWGALLLGVICACVTCFVLFDDVLRSGAKFTTDHALTLAVILIVAAAAHMWWQQTRNGHVLLGLGLVCLFFAGLAYLVVASGGRNAEVMVAKRNAAHASNSERADRLQKIAEAEFILGPCPEGTPSKDVGERCGLRQVRDAECKSGKGKKCDGKSYSVTTYEAAIEGHRAALAKLPELEENGAIKSAAQVFVALKGTPLEGREAAEKDYAGRLELLLPYIKAVLVEVATVVFLAVALGNRRATVAPMSANSGRDAMRRSPQKPSALPATVASPVWPETQHAVTVTLLRPPATVARNCEALAMQLLQRSTAVAQEDIVQLFGGNKSKASRWLGRVEREGRITRWGKGRSKFASLCVREDERCEPVSK